MIDLKTKYRKQTAAHCLRNFHDRFWNIPVSRAAEILMKLGHGHEVIWWASVIEPDKRFSWSAQKFGENEKTSGMLARRVRSVEFYGGPPERLCNHSGTLLTVLLDRLLLAVMLGGFNALDAAIPIQESYH